MYYEDNKNCNYERSEIKNVEQKYVSLVPTDIADKGTEYLAEMLKTNEEIDHAKSQSE